MRQLTVAHFLIYQFISKILADFLGDFVYNVRTYIK